MTNREQEILELIKKNPMISQNEIAETLGIARSSVAVHISNLIKKGYILGRGYIVRPNSYVAIVGGANIDIQGFPYDKLIYRDSNPGKVKVSLGGVGRNIGENLARLGVPVKLISVLGSDVLSKKIIDESKIFGVDMKDSLVIEGESASTYLSILDENGDMTLAISYMDLFDRMTVDFIKQKSHIIENALTLVIDTNIPTEVIEYIVTTFKDKDFFLDTVSATKAKKVKDLIGYFHTIKPNKIEAEMLSGIKIDNEDDLRRAGEYFLKRGVKRVFISLGSEGVYFDDGENSGRVKGPNIPVVNATGAGDAFMAALVYAYINDESIEESAKMGIAASMIALSHENTISPNMSIDNIELYMKEVKIC